MAKAKPGPKTQPGLRKPSGDLRPLERNRDVGGPPAQVKRLFDQALRKAADPRMGTVIGLLYLQQRLTARQFATGEAYAKLRGRFDKATMVPRRTMQSPSYGDATSRAGSAPPLDEEAYVALVQRHTALLVLAGRRYPVLERACIDDSYVAEDEMRILRAGLDSLVDFLGIDRAS